MLIEEIWKDVEGYEKLYQVSNLGRVRSLGRDRACCHGKPRYQTAGGFRWRYKVITTDNGKS